MSDLISRSVVMDFLREEQANLIIAKNTGKLDKELATGALTAVEAVIDFVVQAPTAFDVEKVITQLILKGRPWNPEEHHITVSKAIEIVKSGGADD